jgi:hypothetical protein
MANANDWAIDLENTVTALVKSTTLTQLKKKYPKIVITNEGENSGQAAFPTVYIHLLPAVEQGQTLDGQTVNALLATFQVDVTTNTSKSDCRKVMAIITDTFKTMRFQGTSMPEFSISNKVHKSTARFRRMIAANDRLM